MGLQLPDPQFKSGWRLQKKAHIVYQDNVCFFLAKFAFGEWNMASPCEIASLWNICFANVKRRISFHILRSIGGVRYFTIHKVNYFTLGNAEYFTEKRTVLLYFYFNRSHRFANRSFAPTYPTQNGKSHFYFKKIKKSLDFTDLMCYNTKRWITKGGSINEE